MRRFRLYRDVPDTAVHPVLEQVGRQRVRLASRLAEIKHVVVIASGKGGVGKSAVAANLAAALARRGHRVGAVDADLNGPSLARMLGAPDAPLSVGEKGITPAEGVAGIQLVSMELLLNAPDTPLRWRGPAEDEFLWRGALEAGALREFISDVAWNRLDYLVIDLPPGTDQIQNVLELVPHPAAVLVVTTPSAAAVRVVARSVRLLRDRGIERVALVANMTACVCPHCGGSVPLFEQSGSPAAADFDGLDCWAEVPFDPRLAEATDAGRPLVLEADGSGAATALLDLADRLARECET